MSTFTVALLQVTAAGNDQMTNLARGEAACRRAKLIGADIALFPEMWNVGYSPAATLDPEASDVYRAPSQWVGAAPAELPPAEDIWKGLAIGRDSPFVRHFQQLAAELDLAIAITYLEEWSGPPRNSVSIINRHGAIILTYAKVHTCAFSPNEATLTSGTEFPVAELDTAVGPVRLGAMICYDMEFPESARSLMLGGAELILMPSGTSVGVHRMAQLRSRAAENMVGLAMANYPAAGGGHSVAFDGIAYAKGNPRDSLVIEAGEADGIYPAVFDITRLRDYRLRETWGNAFRRPSTYSALVSDDVEEPFIRLDRGGDPAAR